MYWEEACRHQGFPQSPFCLDNKVERLFGETENGAPESFISPFLASFLDGVMQLSSTRFILI